MGRKFALNRFDLVVVTREKRRTTLHSGKRGDFSFLACSSQKNPFGIFHFGSSREKN